MAEIGRWGGHTFEVSSTLIRSFSGLQITGSSETEDRESGGQKYAARKNGNPKEVRMTLHLNAQLGCDVRTDAMALVDEATEGKKDYFYIGNKKLMTCQLMLTGATVSEIALIGQGTWTRADVQITMKQCSKNDGTIDPAPSSSGSSGSASSSGSTSSAGGTSQKASVKSSGTTSQQSSSWVEKVVEATKGVTEAVKDAVTAPGQALKDALSGKNETVNKFWDAAKDALQKAASSAEIAKKASKTAKNPPAGGGNKNFSQVTMP